ncbi:hypothetical protein GCM10022266_05690 [Agrococcus terreus]
MLTGLGVLGTLAFGLGLLPALAGAILGFVAVRKNPEAKPWPLIAGIVGAVAALASAILFTVNIVNAIAWIEYYSAF